MLDFSKADIMLDLDEVKSKVSDLEIFKRYCFNFKEINKDFLSEFYEDKRPSCRIYRNSNNELRYKDFGTGEYYSSFGYVMRKYYCTINEAINIISNDFKLKEVKIDIKPKVIASNDIINTTILNNRSKIEIVPQPYTLEDRKVWRRFKIPLYYLQEYDILSCSAFYLIKDNKTILFERKKGNPIYAITLYDINNEFAGYKIYKPLETNKRYKWLNTGDNKIVLGLNKLPKNGDLLILTKSIKDVISYRILGYSAISLQNEGTILDDTIKNALLKRFKAIIANFDNDKMGYIAAKRSGLKSFIIDDYKDLSDFMVDHTLKETKKMINEKISSCNED